MDALAESFVPFGFEENTEDNVFGREGVGRMGGVCSCESNGEPSWTTRAADVKKIKTNLHESGPLAVLIGLGDSFDFPVMKDVELEFPRSKVTFRFLKSAFLRSQVVLFCLPSCVLSLSHI
jgi:hypothetical protein